MARQIAPTSNTPEQAQYIALTPEERMTMAKAALSQDQVRESLSKLTGKAREFLKFRAIATSDTEARHLFGAPRRDGNTTIPCACSRQVPGWSDLRETTMHEWKKNKDFMIVYAAIQEPLMLAAVQFDSLALAAFATYQDLLTNPETKDSVRRLAARDVMQITGLLQVEGTSQKGSAAVSSMQIQIIKERLKRGYALAPAQMQMLKDAGMAPQGQGEQMLLPAGSLEGSGAIERSLDGEDEQVIWDDGGDDNVEYLPD